MGKQVSDIAQNASPADVIGGDEMVITGNPTTQRFKAIPSSKGFVSKQNLKKAVLHYLGIVFPSYTQAEINAMQDLTEHYVVENVGTGELQRWNGTAWEAIGAGGISSIPTLAEVLATDANNAYQFITGGNFLHADDNNIDVLVNALGVALITINSNNLLRIAGAVDFGDDEAAAVISRYGIVAPTMPDLQARDNYFNGIKPSDGTLINVNGIGYYRWDANAATWVQFGNAPDSRPYKVFTALVTYMEETGFTAVVLEDTTEGITFVSGNPNSIPFATNFSFARNKFWATTGADSVNQSGAYNPNLQVLFEDNTTDAILTGGFLHYGTSPTNWKNIPIEFRFYN